MRTLSLVLLLAACSSNEGPGLSTPLFAPTGTLHPEHPWQVQVQTVDVLIDVLSGELHPDAAPTPATLQIPAFDLALTAQLTRIDSGASWVGTVDGDPLGEVVFSRSEEVLAGSIHAYGRTFTLGSEPDGTPVLVELAPDQMPADGIPVEVGASPDPVPLTASDANDPVQMLVVYTPAAVNAVGGTSAMQALIGVSIAETNQGYVNSGVAHRVALAGTAEVSYSENGFNWETALGRLAGTSDGHMDDVHALRDSVGADQVTLIVNASQYCGLAYLMSTPSSSFATNAFSLVYHGCATGYYSFGHELGHNMGSTHDHANGAGGAFAHSYGYQSPTRAFRTIMAYNCASGGCSRVNYWSNPSVSYGGQAMGVAGAGPTAAHNAASLDQTASIVAGFRESLGTTVSGAVLTEPVPGSAFTATSVTFRWDDANADEYRLVVGNSPGGAQIANKRGLGADATSVVVSNLPQDGRTVHVRLWSRFDQEWVSRDATFTAVDVAQATAAQLTSPASGSQMTSDALSLAWTDVGASSYHVFVGRYPGDRSLADTATTATSLVIPGLPRDGRPLYVRLFSDTMAGWLSSDLSITAASPAQSAAGTLSSPAPGTTLTEPDVSFAWTDVGADEYHLFVGYRPGSREVFSASAGRQGFIGVGGLPIDGGDLHARLWTRSGTQWRFTDSVYRSPEEAVSTPSVITSPSPGSTLSGGSATWIWSDEDADEYALFVGYAPGHRELFDSSTGTLTSRTVSGLPRSGRTVWVRVWARVDDVWAYSDASFIAGP